MSSSDRRIMAFTLLLVLGGISLVSMHLGMYGTTLFALCPLFLGGLASWILRPATGSRAAFIGAGAVVAAALTLLVIHWEGIICVAMALPMVVPLAALGGWLLYRIESPKLLGPGVAMMLLFPAGILWDAKAVSPIYRLSSAVEIAAAPEQVWKHVTSFSEIPEPPEWYFRAGLAYPKRARIEGSVRYCEFSTGPFVEPIEVWDEPRLLRFSVTENPAPLHEWSPYSQIFPKHLHGYFISKQGQFQLTELPNHHTLLEGTTWYQHGLFPAAYWRLWSDAIIHRIHLRVLHHIRTLAEQS